LTARVRRSSAEVIESLLHESADFLESELRGDFVARILRDAARWCGQDVRIGVRVQWRWRVGSQIRKEPSGLQYSCNPLHRAGATGNDNERCRPHALVVEDLRSSPPDPGPAAGHPLPSRFSNCLDWHMDER